MSTLILQNRKVRPRMAGRLAQEHTARKCRTSFGPVLWGSKALVLSTNVGVREVTPGQEWDWVGVRSLSLGPSFLRLQEPGSQVRYC